MNLTKFSKIGFALAVLKGIFVTSLFLSLILLSIPVLSFNSNIWALFQERSDVILNEDVRNYNNLIIEFLKSGLGLDFLNEKELSHMKDVKEAITVVNILLAFSFVYVVSGFTYFSKSQKKFLLYATRKTSLFVFVITMILSVLILLSFQTSFFIFHKIFFVENFIFPANSLLKTLYPDEFFRELGAFYLISILITSFIVTVVSHRLKLK